MVLFLREAGAPAEARAHSSKLGVSLVFPEDVGKESARNESRFFDKPPPGPWRRSARSWLCGDTHPLPPWHQAGKRIIGPPVGIVSEFRPDFLGVQERGGKVVMSFFQLLA